jgi:plasmid stabilization system protein ParE
VREVLWSARAERDLLALRHYIARDNPTSAQRVVTALAEFVEGLAHNPRRGRLQTDGFREAVEPRYRYVVRYDVLPHESSPERILILSIWHPKQAR